MGEGKVIKKKKKRRKMSSVEWSKEEELNLLKKLVEFSSNNFAREELYPFLRNGSSLAELSKIQIFDKIQQLKNKYLNFKDGDDDYEREDEAYFELSKRLWGETAETIESVSTKALDASHMSYFEGRFESHGLESYLFTQELREETKKEGDELFCLQNHHFLNKSNLNAQLAQLKHQITQARFKIKY